MDSPFVLVPTPEGHAVFKRANFVAAFDRQDGNCTVQIAEEWRDGIAAHVVSTLRAKDILKLIEENKS